MADASWVLQKAIYERLTGYAPLMAAVTGVFDWAPQGQATPYVTIGDDTSSDWSDKAVAGQEMTLTLHAWAESRGRKTVKQILSHIHDALHRHALVVPGFTLVSLDFEFSETFLDEDGVTYHGVIRFRALIHS